MSSKELKALRYNEGKPELSQIPFETEVEVAKVFMYGQKKYTRNNWKNGFKYSSLVDSTLRHFIAWFNGQEIDPESGLTHMAHFHTNVEILHWYTLHPEKGEDDRYKEN